MSEAWIDQPRAVRGEDQLDVAAVAGWLAARVPGLQGVPAVRQFRGGASNLTYQLDYPLRSLILRRPPFGHKAKSAHDMGREVRVLRALAGKYPVPEVLAFCDDPTVAGDPFYVMEKLSGVILRTDLPAGFLPTPAATRAVCDAVLRQLVALHGLDVHAHGLAHLGRGEGYVARQIEGWSRRYRAARTPDAPDGEAVMAWLAQQQPADAGVALIHGDFRFDNVVLDAADPSRVLGVLDWEMATLGCPLMDVGNSLAYWVEAGDPPALQAMRRQPTHAPGMRSRAEVWEAYAAWSGRPVAHTLFYEVYGLFRLMGILQQIWFRVVAGQTTNPAFAGFGAAVHTLDQRCRAWIGA